MYLRRSTLLVCALMLSVKVLWVIFCVQSLDQLDANGFPRDLVQRKNYLLSRVVYLKFGPEESPRLLPAAFREEWAIGTLSMTGAALTNLSMHQPEQRSEYVSYLKKLIERMLKPDIRQYEHRYWGEDALDSLDGSNGHIGYLGHLNLLLGAHRIISGSESYLELHRDISKALARRVSAKQTRYLETFPGQIYIPDNAAAIASLSLFEQVYGDVQVKQAIEQWLQYSKSNLLDKETGILVPWVDGNGKGVGRPRGSYATWNVFYLLQIDQVFAKQQAGLIRKHLLADLPFGACGIREFLPGVAGVGDVDSGPVIFGMSTSGTGFGLASARALNDAHMLRCLLTTAEIVGSSVWLNQKRRYLFAPLIGDAIILAMRTAQTWVPTNNKPTKIRK